MSYPFNTKEIIEFFELFPEEMTEEGETKAIEGDKKEE